MKHFHCAVIPVDGIGPEVIAASQQVLQRLAQVHGGVNFAFQAFDWGSARYERTGAMMPSDGVQQLAGGGFNGILLGPVGSATIPDHGTLWGLLLPLFPSTSRPGSTVAIPISCRSQNPTNPPNPINPWSRKDSFPAWTSATAAP